ncbi:hypothetical protein ACI2U9_17555 [Ralstonia nicotianae]
MAIKNAKRQLSDHHDIYVRIRLSRDGWRRIRQREEIGPVRDDGVLFWTQVSALGRRLEDEEYGLKKLGESLIEGEFSEALNRRVFQYLVPPAWRLPPVDFRMTARVEAYGSVLLCLSAFGLDRLAALIQSNPDQFLAIIEFIVAASFDETFELPEGLYESAITNASSLRALLEPEGNAGRNAQLERLPSRPGPNASVYERVGYLWALSLRTYALPVILALAVCFVGLNAWYQERTIQQAQREELAKERSSIVDLAKSQISSLTQQNAELSKALAQNSASTVVAVTQQNTELVKAALQSASSGGTCCSSTGTLPHKPQKPQSPAPFCKKTR